MLPALIEIALAYHRQPLAYPHFRDRQTPLPHDFAALIPPFCVALTRRAQVHTARHAAISVAELQTAAGRFLRDVLLLPGGDHYRCLGLTPAARPADIRAHYALLIRLCHPDHPDRLPAVDDRMTARLNEAYQHLRQPALRAAYDATLPRGRAAPSLAAYCAPRRYLPRLPWRRPRGRGARRPWTVLLLAMTLIVLLVLQHAPAPPRPRPGHAPPPAPAAPTRPTPLPAAATVRP